MVAGKLPAICSLLLLLTGCVESRYEKYITDSNLKEWFVSNAKPLQLLTELVADSDISGSGLSCDGLQGLNGRADTKELLKKNVNDIRGPIPEKCFRLSVSKKDNTLYALSIDILSDRVCYYSDKSERIYIIFFPNMDPHDDKGIRFLSLDSSGWYIKRYQESENTRPNFLVPLWRIFNP